MVLPEVPWDEAEGGGQDSRGRKVQIPLISPVYPEPALPQTPTLSLGIPSGSHCLHEPQRPNVSVKSPPSSVRFYDSIYTHTCVATVPSRQRFPSPPKFPYKPLKLIPNWGPPMTTDMLTVNIDCFTAFIVHINENTFGLFHRAQYF